MQGERRKNNYSVSILCSILLSPLCSTEWCLPETWQELPMILLLTDNSSVFVQSDLTHQGSLLCFCCKALKRLCLCCEALNDEPLSLCKYSVEVLTFDFVRGCVWKHSLPHFHKSIKAFSLKLYKMIKIHTLAMDYFEMYWISLRILSNRRSYWFIAWIAIKGNSLDDAIAKGKKSNLHVAGTSQGRWISAILAVSIYVCLCVSF